MITIVNNNKLHFSIRNVSSYFIGQRNEIHYIGGADILPPPLSPEEEALLLSQLENDDLYAKSVLIEHNLRLVVYIAKKFDNTGIGVEDLISIGTIGLIKAINTFDPCTIHELTPVAFARPI